VGTGITRTSSVVAAAALSFLSSTALAQSETLPPYSIDIEFLRPTFGHDGFVGLDTPMTSRNLTFRYGTLIQYEQAPLTLYDAVEDQELGAVVTNRFQSTLGVSLDVQRVTFGIALPVAYNWGTETEAFGADGFGAGDAAATVKLVIVDMPRDEFNVGVRGGLILPTGKQEAYIGEGQLRFQAGALAALNVEGFTFATDFGVHTRTEVQTSEDFVAGNEIVWGNGIRFRLPDAVRTSLNVQLLTRAGFENFLQGGAENALEAFGGIDFYPGRRTTIGVAAGRGLTEGYGTTDFRVLGHVLIEIPPNEPPPPQYVAELPPPPPDEPAPIDVIIEEPEEPVFGLQVAVIFRDEIKIKDMVEFVVDTNIVQDYSRPTLSEVAKLINETPQIANLTIEGHASQEGSYDHNYELAESRARRIWEILMEEGVASDRISYRGMGEVEPINEGEDEASLQANRRVVFKIVRQFDAPDEYPDYPDTQVLPWNGKVVDVVQPPRPEPEKPKDEGQQVDEFGIPVDESDDDEIDVGAPGETGGTEE
jgi:outer membrane protein OmpA-like peptidoglycan-associated protein